MATKLVQPPIPASHVVPPIPSITNMMRAHRTPSATRLTNKNNTGFRPISTIKVAEQSSGLVGDDESIREPPSDYRTVAQIKAELYEAVRGINRGIFGAPSEKKSEIEGLVKLLESQNPTPDPTLHLEKVGGCWKLVYSTITILGSKRTKLGLRDFITLGDFFQNIDVAEGKAVNVIKFNARGLNLLNGQLAIEASFEIESNSKSVMENSSSHSSESCTRKEGLHCYFGQRVPIKMSMTEDNPGRRFVRCALFKVKSCGFFEWIDPPVSSQGRVFGKMLLRQNKELCGRIEELDKKIEDLEKKNEEMVGKNRLLLKKNEDLLRKKSKLKREKEKLKKEKSLLKNIICIFCALVMLWLWLCVSSRSTRSTKYLYLA